jgi:VIT1/CCC1 family predicted Fe2+/Mn2+ transporter
MFLIKLQLCLLHFLRGFISVVSLMMGVGAVKTVSTAMLVEGFAGACGMTIGEFVCTLNTKLKLIE